MTSHARRHRPAPADAGENRRQSPRRPASAIPGLKARLFAGSDVRLIDVSRRGVLIETDARLLPGSPISIKFVTTDANLVLKGSVVRSSVNIVSDKGVVYRTAVAFEEDIKLCDESLWEDPAPAESAPEEVPPLQLVHSRDDKMFMPPPVAPASTSVTTVFASSGDDLRKLLVANDW